jgi:hypothetical protein
MAEEISVHCKVILEKGLDKETCYDFRKVRAYVMCKSWDKMLKEKVRFADAIKASWGETKSECARLSAYI